MVDKVTLYRASNGDHFPTQQEAEKAEAYDEFSDLLSRHGLAASVIPAFMSAILEDHGSMLATNDGAKIVRTFVTACVQAENARRAALPKNSKGQPRDDPGPGTFERPQAVPVQAPVRRRAISAGTREPTGDTRPHTSHGSAPVGLTEPDIAMETPMAMHGNEMLPSGPDRPARRVEMRPLNAGERAYLAEDLSDQYVTDMRTGR